jgi:hypothetical protein
MKKLQKKLEFLLDKYDVSAKAELVSESEAVIDGKKKALLPWRAERRIIELHNLIEQGRMTGLSTMRITHVAQKKSDLYKILYREADIFEFVTGEKIVEIFAVENSGVALNAIAKSANGVVCSFELAATLDKGLPVIDKHEVIAVSGNACDRVVDTQVPQNSIYVFGKDVDTYTDVDAELFGLNVDECAIVRHTFELASKGTCNCGAVEHITAVVDAARKSVETVDNIKL